MGTLDSEELFQQDTQPLPSTHLGQIIWRVGAVFALTATVGGALIREYVGPAVESGTPHITTLAALANGACPSGFPLLLEGVTISVGNVRDQATGVEGGAFQLTQDGVSVDAPYDPRVQIGVANLQVRCDNAPDQPYTVVIVHEDVISTAASE